MKLWKIWGSLLLTLCHLPVALAALNSPEGNWTTIDDKTGVKRAVVHLAISNGTLSGTISKVFPQPGDVGVCEKCPGAFKGKKIEGIRIIWGLKDEGKGSWGGGSILDPKTGKIYKVKMNVQGNKLLVRGYVGISALGRTQTWVR